MIPQTLDTPKASRNTNMCRLIVHGVTILIKWIFQYNIHTLLTSYEIIIQLICSGKLSKGSIICSLSSFPPKHFLYHVYLKGSIELTNDSFIPITPMLQKVCQPHSLKSIN